MLWHLQTSIHHHSNQKWQTRPIYSIAFVLSHPSSFKSRQATTLVHPCRLCLCLCVCVMVDGWIQMIYIPAAGADVQIPTGHYSLVYPCRLCVCACLCDGGWLSTNDTFQQLELTFKSRQAPTLVYPCRLCVCVFVWWWMVEYKSYIPAAGVDVQITPGH